MMTALCVNEGESAARARKLALGGVDSAQN